MDAQDLQLHDQVISILLGREPEDFEIALIAPYVEAFRILVLREAAASMCAGCASASKGGWWSPSSNGKHFNVEQSVMTCRAFPIVELVELALEGK